MKASRVYLPLDAHYPRVFDFLVARFSHVSREQWTQRINTGSICFATGEAITLDTPYQGGVHVLYYKSLPNEQTVPFHETIIYEDERILVACKPHFLPVLPAGRFVQETLLSRLQTTTANPELSPAHRIDRGTAGLVLFCKQAKHRGLYQDLFKKRQVHKIYLAVCHQQAHAQRFSAEATQIWKHRIIASEPWFTMAIDSQSQTPNAETEVRHFTSAAAKDAQDCVTLQLRPITGRKHQLRVQLAHMGYPIVNDRFYPETQAESPDCFDSPLQLLAAELGFVDPITQQSLCFHSSRQLKHARSTHLFQ